MTELYRIGEREAQPKSRRRRWLTRLIILLIILLLLFWGYVFVHDKLKPHTVIKQAKATTSKLSYAEKTKHYDEPDFGVDLPASWVALPRPAGPYQSYSWSNGSTSGDEQTFEIFEDNIPANFQVNRVQIVDGEVDHVALDGPLSDNCITFTRNLAITNGEYGALAKWQGVDFICDRSNQSRDVLGTSSADGLNSVNLKDTSTGMVHKFFFTMINHAVSPDYTVFTTIVTSVKMK